MAKYAWHNLNLDEIYTGLKTSEQGLSQAESQRRLTTIGKNELPKDDGHPAWFLFLTQFKSPLMYIMILAIIVSLYIGNRVEGVFIFCVMISNALVGFYQEHKANKSLQALNNTVRQAVRVSRDNHEAEIDIANIVPGDIVTIKSGDKVPADCRIIEQNNLMVNESILTGEAKLAAKTTEVLPIETELGDRTNMLFMGTLIADGSAKVLVVATGLKTEYGNIVSLLKNTAEEITPLQKTVTSLTKIVGLFITVVIAFIVLEGFIAKHPFPVIFETALALFVSAIPEGLLPSITIILVLGMRRILRQRGLVRRLAATETLGGVTVICTDKTGTLTEGTMEVETILTTDGLLPITTTNHSLPSRTYQMLIETAVLASDAYIENPEQINIDATVKPIIRGNYTEQAVVMTALKTGINVDALKSATKITNALLFSSKRKFSANLRTDDFGNTTLYVMGAPEQISTMISSIETNQNTQDLNSPLYQNLVSEHENYVQLGYRTIACAYKKIEPAQLHLSLDELLLDLHLLGFIAMTDPVRADVPEAFEKTRHAGIRTVIVTGDHPLTALAVAQKIGFNVQPDQILLGHEIESMSDETLREKLKSIVLFARMSPNHKIRIVTGFQKNGEVVAMFGDGINDTPALKAADIGVAVNSKIDAAREAADITLLDGGFAVIVNAIEQGRIIFNSIRKVFLYLIVQDFSQFFLFIVSIIAGLPLPLLASQLLLVNLVESGLPDLALTTEQENDGLMNQKPRDPKESIINPTARNWMLVIFIISGALAMLLFMVLLWDNSDIHKIRTMMTAFLCLESLFLVFSMRSFSKSIFRKDIFSNKILTVAAIISLGITIASIYVPFLQTTLSTVSLSLADWIIIISVNLIEIIIIDTAKLQFFSKK